MTKLIEHNGAPPQRIAIDGDITNEEFCKFNSRFGDAWELLPSSECTYALFDKIDDCFVIVLKGDDLLCYLERKAEFLKSWDKDRCRDNKNVWTIVKYSPDETVSQQALRAYNMLTVG